jgi:hypothetical protein
MQHATYQQFSGNTGVWNVTWTTYQHADLRWRYQLSYANAFTALFNVSAILFVFVVQLGITVREKEERLREALKMIGMNNAAYWFSWLLANAVLLFACTLITLGFSYVIGIKSITVHDFAVPLVCM